MNENPRQAGAQLIGQALPSFFMELESSLLHSEDIATRQY